MPALVVDTHSIVWYLTKSPALSKTAEAALDAATAEGEPILGPSICLVETLVSGGKGHTAR
jgi:PIN domain nuclease of toxin-antitoxin system